MITAEDRRMFAHQDEAWWANAIQPIRLELEPLRFDILPDVRAQLEERAAIDYLLMGDGTPDIQMLLERELRDTNGGVVTMLGFDRLMYRSADEDMADLARAAMRAILTIAGHVEGAARV